jgi:hypothetical protein
MSLVVNLFAGPGAGKSSTAYGLTSGLKHLGINAELAPEFAKDLVWSGRTAELENQFLIFGTQLERLRTLERAGLDVIVTDSPILLSTLYKPEYMRKTYDLLVWDEYLRFDNINFFINRTKEYSEAGRMQTEEEARKIDLRVLTLLATFGIQYEEATGDKAGEGKILEAIVRRIMPERRLEDWITEKHFGEARQIFAWSGELIPSAR